MSTTVTATTDRIRLVGLSARGHHGVLPFEREEGQLFTVDLVLDLGERGTAVAAVTDSLDDAVDYAAVATTVVTVIEGEPVSLLETLADRVAEKVLAVPRVLAVEVTVHKPQAPLDVAFEDVSVTIYRVADGAVAQGVSSGVTQAAWAASGAPAAAPVASAAQAAPSQEAASAPTWVGADQVVPASDATDGEAPEVPGEAAVLGAQAAPADPWAPDPWIRDTADDTADETVGDTADETVGDTADDTVAGTAPEAPQEAVGPFQEKEGEEDLSTAALAVQPPPEGRHASSASPASHGEAAAGTDLPGPSGLDLPTSSSLPPSTLSPSAVSPAVPSSPLSPPAAFTQAMPVAEGVVPPGGALGQEDAVLREDAPAQELLEAQDAAALVQGPVQGAEEPAGPGWATWDRDQVLPGPLAEAAGRPGQGESAAAAPTAQELTGQGGGIPVADVAEQVVAPSPAPAPVAEPAPAPVTETEAVSTGTAGRTADPLEEPPGRPVGVVFALGANVGHLLDTLRQAVHTLRQTEGIQVMQVAPLARSVAAVPEGSQPQPDFLNTVVTALTTLSARQLLEVCQGLERDAGRVRTTRWGPRTLDVDLVALEGVSSDDPGLTLPHPHARERAFVLVPWSLADPFAELGGQPVSELADYAPDRSGLRWLAFDWLDTDNIPDRPTGPYVAPPVAQEEPGPAEAVYGATRDEGRVVDEGLAAEYLAGDGAPVPSAPPVPRQPQPLEPGGDVAAPQTHEPAEVLLEDHAPGAVGGLPSAQVEGQDPWEAPLQWNEVIGGSGPDQGAGPRPGI
ncbi:2-amino-4-hydroxy-6-hydroxymethyldihydropteridine diphosphokinase [Actinomyces wuliandei]|uniref:2-amino-4-hydroxy-6- hydroxymethyldihydropteridine diphosphokinase n=1 Tax=Actinomyces wuliandei TaxID=2057743 RepID=UPI001FAB2623|nr:2-amino-4-hydroxy-6-hydroxymethyldihydropteridine diphosphokinase [Actinomyces wuliandei]